MTSTRRPDNKSNKSWLTERPWKLPADCWMKSLKAFELPKGPDPLWMLISRWVGSFRWLGIAVEFKLICDSWVFYSVEVKWTLSFYWLRETWACFNTGLNAYHMLQKAFFCKGFLFFLLMSLPDSIAVHAIEDTLAIIINATYPQHTMGWLSVILSGKSGFSIFQLAVFTMPCYKFW